MKLILATLSVSASAMAAVFVFPRSRQNPVDKTNAILEARLLSKLGSPTQQAQGMSYPTHRSARQQVVSKEPSANAGTSNKASEMAAIKEIPDVAGIDHPFVKAAMPGNMPEDLGHSIREHLIGPEVEFVAGNQFSSLMLSVVKSSSGDLPVLSL
ncbi:hypothetical protein LPJ66_006653 [Kickxella alabastrina]|uniref:Uncharacterized protein n=1 Tax=Kickxella alabastrina TaxID=61397 RepID=A0ACC1IBP0_9FUNG|nr:hypothetical protein LPJ66_006653 [Kickxella alabastrina]